eukprot:TRINITY_DN5667_c0_g1_i2.p1 TRINITY_DN5667_c0_g1~~TRINITY_DN5667_c0_g1_i2.p1  ORF type:complete len:146 (-),score=17.53 TRINITY_DN5667_c0_g1_i2:140-577(-)
METHSQPIQPVAVTPKEDCPHVDTILLTPQQACSSFTAACSDCHTSFENWLCLTCPKVSCSRYVAGHAAVHAEKSGHHIALSFSDLSVWCYSCDSYIVDYSLDPILHAVRTGLLRPSLNKELWGLSILLSIPSQHDILCPPKDSH